MLLIDVNVDMRSIFSYKCIDGNDIVSSRNCDNDSEYLHRFVC